MNSEEKSHQHFGIRVNKVANVLPRFLLSPCFVVFILKISRKQRVSHTITFLCDLCGQKLVSVGKTSFIVTQVFRCVCISVTYWVSESVSRSVIKMEIIPLFLSISLYVSVSMYYHNYYLRYPNYIGYLNYHRYLN